MGLSTKKNTTETNQNTTSHLTTTPTNPAWVDQGLASFGEKVNGLTTADPFSFIAGPDALQTQAAKDASGLTSSGGFGQASDIANGVAGAATPSISGHLSEFMNPYLDSVVKNSLAGYDQNAGYTRANDVLAKAGDETFGGSGGAIQTALNEQNIAQGRSTLDSNLRSQGFNTALQGATSQAGLDSQSYAQRLAAAGLLSSNATAEGADSRANIDTKSGLGGILQGLAQQKAGSPLALMAAQSGLYGSLPLGLLHGQTADGTGSLTGTSTGTESGASLGDWLNYFASNAKAAASGGGG